MRLRGGPWFSWLQETRMTRNPHQVNNCKISTEEREKDMVILN